MWWQDYPRGGYLGGLTGFTLLFSLTMAVLALLLGWLFRTRERSAQLLRSTAMPLLFVSGLSRPVRGASLYEVRIELAVLAVTLRAFGAAGLLCWLRPPAAARKPARDRFMRAASGADSGAELGANSGAKSDATGNPGQDQVGDPGPGR